MIRYGRRRLVAAAVGAVAVVAVLLGPRPVVHGEWVEPELPDDLDAWLAEREAAVPDLRPGDEKAIAWLDPAQRSTTAVAIVYLHGFSADRHEIEPVVTEVGRRVRANVFFTRLAGHGRDGAAMAEADADDWLGDAAEAVAIGARIGHRVVVIGTSTGGTLATWIATRPEARDRVAGIVLVSPNFHPKNRDARVLLYPWGERAARVVVGTERCFEARSSEQARHWTTCYPTSALAPMMGLVEHLRKSDLSGATLPMLVLHSSDDAVVDALETERVLLGLGRPAVTRTVATTDPDGHVLAGDILSPETTAQVVEVIAEFVRGIAP